MQDEPGGRRRPEDGARWNRSPLGLRCGDRLVKATPAHELGVVGLATMGQNLARNLASHGVRVAIYNRTRHRTDGFMTEYAAGGGRGGLQTLGLQPGQDEAIEGVARPFFALDLRQGGARGGDDGAKALLEMGNLCLDS